MELNLTIHRWRLMPQQPARASKWVHGIAPETPASEAGRITLQQRLDCVLEYLPLAAKHADDDVEYVHQLRVWTRRSTAALDVFQRLLPDARRDRLRKQLRRIRRAAGTARDLDVMLIRFRSQSGQSGGKPLRRLIENLETRRQAAQVNLTEARKLMRDAGFAKSVRGLIRRTRWRDEPPEPAFLSCARELLEQAATRFFARSCIGSENAERLHRMRLEAKQFRYTAEIVAPAFDPEFRKQFYAELADLQDCLGRISDHKAASELFQGWSDKSSSGRLLLRMSRQEFQAIGGEIDRFQGEWSRQRLDELQQTAAAHIRADATRDA